MVLAAIGADDDAAAQVAQRRARLHADLERAQQYLLSGYITEEQFRAKRAEIQANLAALQPLAAEVDLDEAAARLKDLGRTWADATDDERREIARAFFEAVYCDLDRKQVIAVKMKSTLSPFKSVLSHDDAPNSDVPPAAQSCRNAEPTGFGLAAGLPGGPCGPRPLTAPTPPRGRAKLWPAVRLARRGRRSPWPWA
jgi:hypothetical protein